ncbi:MAG: hypothetical protein K8823_1188 [Cenarchaeum symbiont of Oopsacas minuta]|nr:hypothetical protein [Cenarchaeum symbiont of Oopsacas minuta]
MPNAQEMDEIYSRTRLRESTMISLMAKSGLRPKVLGNHNGTDGLRMHDLLDIVIHQGEAKCIRVQNRITVRREISKTRKPYFTFSSTPATTYILAYLNDRLSQGEPLHGNSPVIARLQV